jgi:hypothetical protein
LTLGGVRNLVRADLMAIFAFYFLTFYEFLFPQPNFNNMVDLKSAHLAMFCVELGFAGLLIGRHLVRPKKQPFSYTLTHEIPAIWIVSIFWACVFVGYLHMLIAVDFNIFEMLSDFMDARFSQPWQRGRLGDWKALLVELGLFIYLIPPLGGIMLARRHRYSKASLVCVSLGLALTFFYGFSSGTRNIFATYLVTFLIAYSFALPVARRKELVTMYVGCGFLMVASAYVMLQFRTVGFHNWITGHYIDTTPENRTMFVDYNLYTIAGLTKAFPAKHDYLGWETPYLALIRPIPRALWAGKPEGLSVTMEEIFDVQGLTLGASFVGESYMSGGLLVVAIVAVCFGIMTGWWNYLASSRNSELGILIYSSGFFATVISMRSLFEFTTALLPTMAALVICTYAVRMLAKQAGRLLSHAIRRSAHDPRRPPQARK